MIHLLYKRLAIIKPHMHTYTHMHPQETNSTPT